MKTSAATLNEQKINTFKSVHAEFKTILENEKCRSCSCFYREVLEAIYKKLRRFQQSECDNRLVEIEKDFKSWIQTGGLLKMHE